MFVFERQIWRPNKDGTGTDFCVKLPLPPYFTTLSEFCSALHCNVDTVMKWRYEIRQKILKHIKGLMRIALLDTDHFMNHLYIVQSKEKEPKKNLPVDHACILSSRHPKKIPRSNFSISSHWVAWYLAI